MALVTDGTGTLDQYRYPDGSVYNGQWNSEDQRHGYGRLTLSDGSMFRGHFNNGFYCGLGVLDFSDGSRYEGEFRHGKFHGHGVFVQSDKTQYEGEFRDGKICGFGLVTFPNGSNGLPRNEGYFDGTKIVRRERCSQNIQKARDMANKAREQDSS